MKTTVVYHFFWSRYPVQPWYRLLGANICWDFRNTSSFFLICPSVLSKLQDKGEFSWFCKEEVGQTCFCQQQLVWDGFLHDWTGKISQGWIHPIRLYIGSQRRRYKTRKFSSILYSPAPTPPPAPANSACIIFTRGGFKKNVRKNEQKIPN